MSSLGCVTSSLSSQSVSFPKRPPCGCGDVFCVSLWISVQKKNVLCPSGVLSPLSPMCVPSHGRLGILLSRFSFFFFLHDSPICITHSRRWGPHYQSLLSFTWLCPCEFMSNSWRISSKFVHPMCRHLRRGTPLLYTTRFSHPSFW